MHLSLTHPDSRHLTDYYSKIEMIPLSWIHWQNDDEHNIAEKKSQTSQLSSKTQNFLHRKTFLSHPFHLPSFNLSLEKTNIDTRAKRATSSLISNSNSMESKSWFWLGKFKTHSSARCLKITEKVSFNIASEASYVYILIGQKLIKNAKNGPFWLGFETLKLAVK